MNGAMWLRRNPPTDLLEEGRGLRPYRYAAMTMLCETVLRKKAAEYGMPNANCMAACLLSMCVLLCFFVLAKKG